MRVYIFVKIIYEMELIACIVFWIFRIFSRVFYELSNI